MSLHSDGNDMYAKSVLQCTMQGCHVVEYSSHTMLAQLGIGAMVASDCLSFSWGAGSQSSWELDITLGIVALGPMLMAMHASLSTNMQVYRQVYRHSEVICQT